MRVREIACVCVCVCFLFVCAVFISSYVCIFVTSWRFFPLSPRRSCFAGPCLGHRRIRPVLARLYIYRAVPLFRPNVCLIKTDSCVPSVFRALADRTRRLRFSPAFTMPNHALSSRTIAYHIELGSTGSSQTLLGQASQVSPG